MDMGIYIYVGKTNIYTDFDNLEDAIDCCIASSHIPFITGTLINKYKNNYAFDGGFSSYPYLNIKRPSLHITPSVWNENEKRDCSFLKIENFNLEKLYEKGYLDTEKKGKNKLDEIFLPKEQVLECEIINGKMGMA
jgi:hypothetical protein